jgi:asparagine synthase (glutamine-hydrolysing)
MCGIAGIYTSPQSSARLDVDELNCIRDAMSHRGPDDAGTWVSENLEIGLANRRLKIFDLSDNAHQPMGSDDGNLLLTFNGAIYNHQELRSDLENRGYRFRSKCDTEVLLYLYKEKGEAMLDHLRGMFAFAIWNREAETLFLARDPFGIKPLYYADDGKSLRFASEVKALLKSPSVSREIDPAGAVGFYLLGSVPEPHTIFRDIKQLPAGTSMTLRRDGSRKIKRYCNIQEIICAEYEPHKLTPIETREKLAVILRDSVQKHLIADVPTGCFLSAGRDSGTLVGLASELKQNSLNTVTLGFEEFSGTQLDETSLAEEVAKHYGTTQTTSWITREDFKNSYSEFLASMDQPTIDALNTYFVSRVAAQSGLKVALSGVGGDELFGGYPSFQDIPKVVNSLRWLGTTSLIGRGFRKCSAPILRHFTSPKYAGILEYGGSYRGAYLLRRGLFMPWELPGIMDADIVKEGWRSLAPELLSEEAPNQVARTTKVRAKSRVSSLEMNLYMRNQLLRDTDWAGMAHSLEVRTPFVDILVLKELSKLRSHSDLFSKEEMIQSLKKPLPEKIQKRPKSGFVVPIRDWIADEQSDKSAMRKYQARGLRGWARQVFQQYVESVSN